jgi:DNA-binding CsgD family transcriptional regulator
MREDDGLRCVIGSVYDAALDPALWTHALAKIADFVGGQAGGLCWKDAASRSIDPQYLAGLDPRCMQRYSESYSELDPLTGVPHFEVEQVVSIPELVPYDDYRRGRFYQEWARPQGWGDVASAVLEKSENSCTFLNIVRTEASGMVDDEMRRRMALVVPHVRRAVRIGKTVDAKTNKAAIFADILDGLSAGLFLVEADGRIAHANAAAQRILRGGDFLRSIGGRLVAANTQANRTLREIFAAADAAPEAGIKGTALRLTVQDDQCYVAHVLPLATSARRRAGVGGTVAAAVLVRKATLETAASAEIIGETYNLTPSELRVLLGIVDVGGVPEVATALGVADSTVKTHLGRLFEKTGAARQADLVKLVAGFSNPLMA